MPEYRRVRVENAAYFFTVVTYQRKPIFLDPLARSILHETWLEVQQNRPFQVTAICLLPDHIHCIWTLPEEDTDYSIRWHEIKRKFTYIYSEQIHDDSALSLSRQKRKERNVWQRRFWEHTIRDDQDLANHLDYIHYNPVKHSLVTKPCDWEWSSFHRYVRMGVYEKDWGETGMDNMEGVENIGE
jgi:putative transposase